MRYSALCDMNLSLAWFVKLVSSFLCDIPPYAVCPYVISIVIPKINLNLDCLLFLCQLESSYSKNQFCQNQNNINRQGWQMKSLKCQWLTQLDLVDSTRLNRLTTARGGLKPNPKLANPQARCLFAQLAQPAAQSPQPASFFNLQVFIRFAILCPKAVHLAILSFFVLSR